MYSDIWPMATPAEPATPPSAPRSCVLLPTMLASTLLDDSADLPTSSRPLRSAPVSTLTGVPPTSLDLRFELIELAGELPELLGLDLDRRGPDESSCDNSVCSCWISCWTPAARSAQQDRP